MKIIYTADLHGIEVLYSQLFQLAVNWQAEARIIATIWGPIKGQTLIIIMIRG